MALKVQNLKYDARTHKAIRQIRRLHVQSDKAQLIIIEQQKNKNSTSANIVDAIRILAIHWASKVALKVQNLKYDARTHKAIRHSWSSVNKTDVREQICMHRLCHISVNLQAIKYAVIAG